MRIPKPAKDMLTYLPVLAVLGAAVIGLLIGKGLYPTSLDSQSTTPTQFSIEPKNLQLLLGPGAGGACVYGAIYTSLPPKCKTADGKLIPLPGTSSTILLIPERK